MSFPTPEEIKSIAASCGYEERREEISSTLFFKDVSTPHHHPTLINVFYTTRGVMTKISHPKSGYNQLWRNDAYESLQSLVAIFKNPRTHSGKGYRTIENSVRGCAECGHLKKREDFSKNQWRKGLDLSKCTHCVQNPKENYERTVSAEHELNRDFIECDAGCRKSSPSIRCTRCLTVYYCSEDCQRRHQHAHSPDCRDIHWMREQVDSHVKPSKQTIHGTAMAAMLAGRTDFPGMLLKAQYYQDIENWEGAMECYKSVYGETINRSPPEQRQVIMGLCRCLHEIGKYEGAIEIGMSAIDMNRHFPEVHKYVALAQKASGDHDAAKITMRRAVLYETPWDDKNIEANKALLQEM